ncbi:MAG TPA: hypothetical protein VLB04_10580 [Methanotrichaceae archaeon]|nr:hypothetical protein [Methanotrichaceae archaeon]
MGLYTEAVFGIATCFYDLLGKILGLPSQTGRYKTINQRVDDLKTIAWMESGGRIRLAEACLLLILSGRRSIQN